MPAPQRIAPYASALSADVTVDDNDVGTGRIILLHDPAGNDAWDGTFRCVAYARAEIELELITDPMLAAVGWSWLTEALDGARRGVRRRRRAPSPGWPPRASAGWPTRAAPPRSRSAPRGRRSRRATTDRRPLDIAPHVEAWGELLCTAAGLPPVPEGVAAMPSRRGQRGADAELMRSDDDDPPRARPTPSPSPTPEPGAAAHPARRPAAGRRDRRGASRRCATRSPPAPARSPSTPSARPATATPTAPTCPAAPRGRRHRADRPDRVRRPSRRSQEALDGTEWILHAATQDLPCLAEIGLRPTTAVRHRARRPPARLPPGRPGDAGRDAARLPDAQGALRRRLVDPAAARAVAGVRRPRRRGAGRAARRARGGARGRRARPSGRGRSSTHLPQLRAAPERVEAWRRTSGLHRVRGRRALGAVRALWETRDEIARAARRHARPDPAGLRDRRGGAGACPPTGRRCSRTKGFHGRGAERYATRWVAALRAARDLPEDELPTRAPRGDGPPRAARLGREGPGRRPPPRCWPARR